MIYDLTLDIETGMPTCGTPWHQAVSITKMGTIEEVGRNTSQIIIGSHSGTHMDSPLHFINGEDDVRSLDLNLLCGDVSIVDFTRFGKGDVVHTADVKEIGVSTRMLFRFDWFKKWKTKDYYDGFPYFTIGAVQYLYNHGMRLMALDTPSPDFGGAIKNISEDDSPNHKYLLKNKVVIIEYLSNTDKIKLNKNYEIIALPLKLKGSDGSPSRVILREV